MRRRSPLIVMLGVTVLLCGGCVARGDYLQKQAEVDSLAGNLAAAAAEKTALREQIDRLTSQRDALIRERDRLTAERDDLTARLTASGEQLTRTTTESRRALRELEKRNSELEGDVQMLRESVALVRKNEETAVREVSSTYEGLLKEMQAEVEQGQITISELKGRLTVDVLDKILFDSGSAEIKPAGISVLKRVVDILISVADRTIRVEGHTDNVPIRGALAKRYPSNWELSAARALTVTRYLEEQGIDPRLLSAAAYGEHQPVAENETAEGRAKNRRIAIILLPKEEP